MIEIIPNWHPMFVHFTIGLLTISTLLYAAGFFLKKENLLIAARWNLWIGVTITVGTLLAGFYAYNTVVHDAPSHAAMTNHRNWALLTASIFILLALWALWKQRGARAVSPFFVLAMICATGLLFVTGYKGGEVVYRYGLGVLSMPDMRNHNLIVHSNDADPRTDKVKSTEVPTESHEKNHGDHHH